MEGLKGKLGEAARFAAEVVAETLWPTRCALCDGLGKVLCERCEAGLTYVDWWRACRRCGSPFGHVQCDLCNPIALERLRRDDLPFAGCSSAVMFDESAGCIVRAFKDQGEQRLSAFMASAMARALPPYWRFDAITYVPATHAAFRRRGFDHMELVARALSDSIGCPYANILARPLAQDQRSLSGKQRIENLAGRFSTLDCAIPQRALLVDDVFTTGATLCAATDALLAAGCEEVFCLTFARV